MKKTPKNRQNYKDNNPPPNFADLQFQNYQFDDRINNGRQKATQLSPRFFNSIFADKTLTWQLGDRIRRAGKILKDLT